MTDYDYLPPQASDRDYLQVIAEVSQTINSILDLDQLLTRVSELIRTKFNIPYVHIYLKQYVPHTLAYRAGSGERAQTYHEHQIAFNLDAPQGLITLTARTGEGIRSISQDVAQMTGEIRSLIDSLGEISAGGAQVNQGIEALLRLSVEVKGLYDSIAGTVGGILARIGEMRAVSDTAARAADSIAR